MIYNLKSRLNFGKHKWQLTGETIEDIIKTDPEYLDWCLGEIKDFGLDETAQEKLDEALDDLGYDDLYDYDIFGGEH